VLTPETEISDHADSYLYAPEGGTVTLHFTLAGAGRVVGLYLDQQVVERWPVNQELTLAVPLTLSWAGYHTATLAVEPPCPVSPHPALACQIVTLTDLMWADWTPTP
ncbi:MAG TPA: hypothetical protein VHO69_12240, partial [Phototrophicaceae bacterium]|nr:hypothetical protein [Phototrophicaceae bacterium]